MLLALMMWMQACLHRLLPLPVQRLRTHLRQHPLLHLRPVRAHTMSPGAEAHRNIPVLATIHLPHRQHLR